MPPRTELWMELKNVDLYKIAEYWKNLTAIKFPATTTLEIVKRTEFLSKEHSTVESVREGIISNYPNLNLENPDPTLLQDISDLMNKSFEFPFGVLTLPTKFNGRDVEIDADTLIALRQLVTVE